MRNMTLVRAALIGLAGLACSGCLEAGPRGYFETSVYGASPVDLGGVAVAAPRPTRTVR